MKHKKLLQVIAAIGLSLPVFAQGGPPPGGPGGMHGPGPEFFGGPGMKHGKVVTSAPYSAAFSNTTVRHLPDGNTLTRTTTGQIARDSQGRTYEQVNFNGGGPWGGNTTPKTLIFISDPVAGYSYVLDSSKMTAVQRPFHPKNNGTAPSHIQRPNTAETPLSADSSSGVVAEGKSITRTIPAGAMGNAQPIVSTDQVWYSPDLQIVVKSIRSNPLFGDSTYALTNVATKEPDPSLFTVPSGYTVTAASPHSHRGPGGV